MLNDELVGFENFLKIFLVYAKRILEYYNIHNMNINIERRRNSKF